MGRGADRRQRVLKERPTCTSFELTSHNRRAPLRTRLCVPMRQASLALLATAESRDLGGRRLAEECPVTGTVAPRPCRRRRATEGPHSSGRPRRRYHLMSEREQARGVYDMPRCGARCWLWAWWRSQAHHDARGRLDRGRLVSARIPAANLPSLTFRTLGTGPENAAESQRPPHEVHPRIAYAVGRILSDSPPTGRASVERPRRRARVRQLCHSRG